MAELFMIEYDITRIIHTTSALGNENGGIFFIRFAVPDY
jgi:hypothetical protein